MRQLSFVVNIVLLSFDLKQKVQIFYQIVG